MAAVAINLGREPITRKIENEMKYFLYLCCWDPFQTVSTLNTFGWYVGGTCVPWQVPEVNVANINVVVLSSSFF